MPDKEQEFLDALERNVARVILRKYGYPGVIRDQVVEKILEAVIQKESKAGEAE